MAPRTLRGAARDGDRPGPRRAGHGRWRVRDAPSARAASLASSAALLTHRATRLTRPAGAPAAPRHSLRQPLRHSLRVGVRTPGFAGRAHQCWSVPLRGASQPRFLRLTGPPQGEWSGQAEWMRFARLIHPTCPRSWRTYGPRRHRRQSQSDLVATKSGEADQGDPQSHVSSLAPLPEPKQPGTALLGSRAMAGRQAGIGPATGH